MSREHLIADPDDSDTDVRERRVDDVGIVRRAGNERVHDGRHARAGADVLAELHPRSRHSGRDRVGVEDLAGIRHGLGVLAGERSELRVDDQWRCPDAGPGLVQQRDELGFVGARVVTARVCSSGHREEQ